MSAPGPTPRNDDPTPTSHASQQGSAGGRFVFGRGVAALWLIVALQVAIPASYYLRSYRDDERFAWRMFSAVRVKKCSVELHEQKPGQNARELDLDSTLHSGWIRVLERGRLSVIERALVSRCENGAESTFIERRCKDAKKRTLPVERYSMACPTRIMRREELP